jgi:hypothetical protein
MQQAIRHGQLIDGTSVDGRTDDGADQDGIVAEPAATALLGGSRSHCCWRRSGYGVISQVAQRTREIRYGWLGRARY